MSPLSAGSRIVVLAVVALLSACDQAPTTVAAEPLAKNTAAPISASLWDRIVAQARRNRSLGSESALPRRQELSAPVALSGSPTCMNGSTVDCNPPGSTLNLAAAFVDPAPPAGYKQCAGFINTPSDDVRWDWENNCLPFKAGPLFVRVFDHTSGALLAGARIHSGIPLAWVPSTGFNYSADSYEGEGLVDNVPPSDGYPGGVSMPWFPFDGFFCGCGGPTCNDIFTANAANNKILYVGANGHPDNEATWGPPGPKNTCSFTSPNFRLRVAIYAISPNSAPEADAGDDVIVQCTGASTAVALDGTGSSDPDGDVLTYSWSAPGVTFDDASSSQPTGGFALGTTAVTLTVSDPDGLDDDDQVQVTVEDTGAPGLTVAATPGSLSPPNHKYVAIALDVTTGDGCDPAGVILATKVVSNQADEGTGDGDTAGDIRVTTGAGVLVSSNASPSVTFNPVGAQLELRAERSGSGAERTYTIEVTATDGSGNTTVQTVLVTVPHDRR